MRAEIEPKVPPRPGKPVRPPYLKCKRCGRSAESKQMHKSIMYDGYICNNSERCLKEKMK